MSESRPSIALQAKVWQAAHLSGTFKLRAGGVSSEYFDKYRFESHPELLREICQALVPLLPDDEEAVAGLELGGVPIATVVSQLSDRPLRLVRKAAKPYGTELQVEGGEMRGLRVTVIEDVATSGRSILDGVEALRTSGAEVATALCVVDREDGAIESLAGIGVELRPLFSLGQLRIAAA